MQPFFKDIDEMKHYEILHRDETPERYGAPASDRARGARVRPLGQVTYVSRQ